MFVACGFVASLGFLLFDLIVWFDFTYSSYITAEQEQSSTKYTDIHLAWPVEIPLLGLLVYFFLNVLFTLLGFKLIVTWF